MEHKVTARHGADLVASPLTGWRSRSVALAALGAVSLSREAFGPRARTQLDPLALQILVAVALQDHRAADSSGYVDGVVAGLTANADGEAAVEHLVEAGLIQTHETPADEADEADETDDADQAHQAHQARLTVTEAGADLIGSWLTNISPLFSCWPPEQAVVDDAR
jgi:hypothetical protein